MLKRNRFLGSFGKSGCAGVTCFGFASIGSGRGSISDSGIARGGSDFGVADPEVVDG